MEDQTKPNLLDLFRELFEDHLGKSEFLKAFQQVIDHVKDADTKNTASIKAISDALIQRHDELKGVNTSEFAAHKADAQQLIATELLKLAVLIDDKLAPLSARIDAIKEIDEDDLIRRAVAAVQLPEQKEQLLDTPEDLRNKLELLQGEERLDASAIRNLPEAVHKTVISGGHGALWGLSDVDVSGIVVGQSIKWDGVRWIPYTPVGGNTAVYGEAPTDNGNGTYTFAHTPVAGTLRLYRGGAYQKLNTDYTLSSATVTPSPVLQSGEVLLADYEY